MGSPSRFLLKHLQAPASNYEQHILNRYLLVFTQNYIAYVRFNILSHLQTPFSFNHYVMLKFLPSEYQLYACGKNFSHA
jgi:hypothetical protein